MAFQLILAANRTWSNFFEARQISLKQFRESHISEELASENLRAISNGYLFLIILCNIVLSFSFNILLGWGSVHTCVQKLLEFHFEKLRWIDSRCGFEIFYLSGGGKERRSLFNIGEMIYTDFTRLVSLFYIIWILPCCCWLVSEIQIRNVNDLPNSGFSRCDFSPNSRFSFLFNINHEMQTGQNHKKEVSTSVLLRFFKSAVKRTWQIVTFEYT